MFIGASRRDDCHGHFAPAAQASMLTKGMDHRKFDVQDAGEKTAFLDKNRFSSKKMANNDARGDMPEVMYLVFLSGALSVPGAPSSLSRYVRSDDYPMQ